MPNQPILERLGLTDRAYELAALGLNDHEIGKLLGVSHDVVTNYFARPSTPPRPARRGRRTDPGAPVANAAPATKSATPMPTDPCETFRLAFGFEPMPHQVDYLGETRNLLCLKGRQIGMSTAAAGLAIHVARSGPGPDVVIVSPSQRQSSEVAFRARLGLWQLGDTLPQDAATVIRLANGSRIISLAGTPRSVRGYSARLLIIDEAAWVPGEVITAALPMTSATKGRVIVQSTAGLMSGSFFDLWQSPPPGWATLRVPSIGILDQAEIEAARARLSPEDFGMEYDARFSSGNAGSVLWTEDEWRALVRTPEEEQAFKGQGR